MYYNYQLKCFSPDVGDFNNNNNASNKSVLISLFISILISVLCVVCYNVVEYYEHPEADIIGNSNKEVVCYNGRPISVHHDINNSN